MPWTTAFSCSYLQRTIITVVMLPPPHQSHKSRQRPTYTWRAKHPVPSSAAHKHGSPIDRLLFKSSLLANHKSFFCFLISFHCHCSSCLCNAMVRAFLVPTKFYQKFGVRSSHPTDLCNLQVVMKAQSILMNTLFLFLIRLRFPSVRSNQYKYSFIPTSISVIHLGKGKERKQGK